MAIQNIDVSRYLNLTPIGHDMANEKDSGNPISPRDKAQACQCAKSIATLNRLIIKKDSGKPISPREKKQARQCVQNICLDDLDIVNPPTKQQVIKAGLAIQEYSPSLFSRMFKTQNRRREDAIKKVVKPAVEETLQNYGKDKTGALLDSLPPGISRKQVMSRDLRKFYESDTTVGRPVYSNANWMGVDRIEPPPKNSPV